MATPDEKKPDPDIDELRRRRDEARKRREENERELAKLKGESGSATPPDPDDLRPQEPAGTDPDDLRPQNPSMPESMPIDPDSIVDPLDKTKKEKKAAKPKFDTLAAAERIKAQLSSRTDLSPEQVRELAIELYLAEKEAFNKEQGGLGERFKSFDTWWDKLDKTPGGIALKTLIGGAMTTAVTAGLGMAPMHLLGVGFRLTARVASATGLNMAATSEWVQKIFKREGGSSQPKEGWKKILDVKNLKYAAMVGGVGAAFILSGSWLVAAIGAGGMTARLGINALLEKQKKSLEEKRQAISLNQIHLDDSYDVNALAANLDMVGGEYEKISASLRRAKWIKNMLSGVVAVSVSLGTMSAAAAEHQHAGTEIKHPDTASQQLEAQHLAQAKATFEQQFKDHEKSMETWNARLQANPESAELIKERMAGDVKTYESSLNQYKNYVSAHNADPATMAEIKNVEAKLHEESATIKAIRTETVIPATTATQNTPPAAAPAPTPATPPTHHGIPHIKHGVTTPSPVKPAPLPRAEVKTAETPETNQGIPDTITLGKNGAPDDLENVFREISADHMHTAVGQVESTETIAKSLNMAGNLEELVKGHNVAGINAAEFAKTVSFKDGVLTIKDHARFDETLSSLQKHAELNWQKGILQSEGAASSFAPKAPAIKDGEWLKAAHSQPSEAHATIEVRAEEHGAAPTEQIPEAGSSTPAQTHEEAVDAAREGVIGKYPPDNDTEHPASQVTTLKVGTETHTGSSMQTGQTMVTGTGNNIESGETSSQLHPDGETHSPHSYFEQYANNFPDATAEQKQILEVIFHLSPEFGKNPYHLGAQEMIHAYVATNKDISYIFPKDTAKVWETFSQVPAKEILSINPADAGKDMGPFLSFIHKLKEIAGDPRGGIIRPKETVREYVFRTMQKAEQVGKTQEVEASIISKL